MHIWIDTDTGTWGNAQDIVILDVDEVDLVDLGQMSDTDIIRFGQEHGDGLALEDI